MRIAAIRYTLEQEEFLRTNQCVPRRELAAMFNDKFNTSISLNNIKAKCTRMGLKTGRTGYFEKGKMPWNKGKKMGTGPNKTSFKPGNKPHNWRPIGSERINRDGYIEIKTEEGINKFRLKHRLIWEQHNGKILDGMVIRFKDGNKLNCDITNLEIVHKYENMWLNKLDYIHAPEELKPAIYSIAKLQMTLKKTKENTCKN